jgi:hypothetical protein
MNRQYVRSNSSQEIFLGTKSDWRDNDVVKGRIMNCVELPFFLCETPTTVVRHPLLQIHWISPLIS